MDDQAALIARRVAMAAAAWFNAPADVEAYRRLAAALEEWTDYCAPRMDLQAGQLGLLPDLATPLRRTARRALDIGEEDVVGQRVAMAAAAWFTGPVSDRSEAYRRLDAAVEQWKDYCAPKMDAQATEELLDVLADATPPQPLSAGLPDLEATLRRAGRDRL